MARAGHDTRRGLCFARARAGNDTGRAMDQDIRFCELHGRRIAYATLGEGPPIVFGAKYVSHLEEEWDDRLARGFYEELAPRHTVRPPDRPGARRQGSQAAL